MQDKFVEIHTFLAIIKAIFRDNYGSQTGWTLLSRKRGLSENLGAFKLRAPFRIIPV